MKQLISLLLFIVTFSANAQHEYYTLKPDTCSCDSLQIWKGYYASLNTVNRELRDTISNLKKNATYTPGYKPRPTYKDSVWDYEEDKYVWKRKHERENFETYFMPGAGYSYYKPKASDSVGSFGGFAVEYLIYATVQQNNNPGPSHVRVYGKLNLQNSSKSDIGQLFWYGMGLDLSIEKNPKRTFLVPYFGLEVGGISNKTLGTVGHFTPIVGVHLLSTKNLFLNLHAGQVYTTQNIEMMQGYFVQGTVNFSLW